MYQGVSRGTENAAQWAEFSRWHALVQAWLDAQPLAAHPAGLQRVCHDLAERLKRLDFAVAQHACPGAAPVLVATRPPQHGSRWVGLAAHYDVAPIEDAWQSDPFRLTVRPACWWHQAEYAASTHALREALSALQAEYTAAGWLQRLQPEPEMEAMAMFLRDLKEAWG